MSPEDKRPSVKELVRGAPSQAHAASAPAAPPHAGQVVKHYELIRPLGTGGMGVVYLARDIRLGRLCAVKILLEHTGTAAQRFLVEARTTAQLRHENVVVIYDVDEIDGYPYLVLEYIRGRTLREALAERVGDTVAAAIEVMLPVVRALACAHELGIIHRDLKPENILLADSGEVKVVDFGIAKHVSAALAITAPIAEQTTLQDDLTEEGALLGTLPYMSPEQRLGEALDARSDVWAVGILLFELATGAHPLAPLSWTTLQGVPRLDVPMPSAHGGIGTAKALADLIDRCLKKRREERPASAKELAEALERLGAERRSTSASPEDESPFTGLSAFQEADEARFFGRDDDVAAVVGRLRHQQLVAVAGASGAGKSSFVRAGVIPALKRAGRELETILLRPGRRPLAALADVLARCADGAADAGVSDPEALLRTLRAQPGHLGTRLRARCRMLGEEHRVLLFVDQLEELYTLGAEPGERAAFSACLEGVADDASSPLRVIVCIRADFLNRVAEDRAFLAAMTRGLLFLPPMTPEGLSDALARPLETVGYRFEDDRLRDEMLEGISGTKSPLPLLQFTATKLWEARDRDKKLLTRLAYDGLGGVAGALSTHANAVLFAMPAAERRLARAIFMRLVTPERTRAVVRMDELCAPSEGTVNAADVIQALAEARLLSIEAGSEREGTTVELAHESLIERWAKLRKWLDDDEQDVQFLAELRSAAAQWEKNGEAAGFLWRDEAARRAMDWRKRRGALVQLGEREIGYLAAVVRLAQRTRRRRTQFVVGLFGALSVIAVAVSALAIRAQAQARRADEQAKRADEQAKRALEEARQARNATRIATARERMTDPTTVLGMLREIEPGPVPRGWAELARWARGAGVASAVLLHDQAVRAVAWSPDGRRIVSASDDKLVRVWSADGSGEPVVLRGHERVIFTAAFSPDGRRVASASEDKTVRVWNADGSGEPLVLRGHDMRVTGAAWSPDGRRIVSASYDKTLRVWNADGSGEPLVFRGHDDGVDAVAWSPDGQRIVSGSRDKTLRVWNADGSGQALVLHGHEDGLEAVAWSPDGQRIASASGDRTVRVWSADGKGQPVVLRGHEAVATSVAWSPDGRRIVSGSTEAVRVWNADGKGEPIVLGGHEGVVTSVAWRLGWPADPLRVAGQDGAGVEGGDFGKKPRARGT